MKIGSFITRIVVFVAIFVLSAAHSVMAAGVGVVSDSGVNVRALSNTSSQIIMTVDKGQSVKINGMENGFFRVSFGSYNDVYIKDDYVTVVEAEAIASESGVNIRTAPSTDAGVTGKADAGDKFTVTEKKGDWYAVNFNGNTAYIHSDFMIGETVDHVKKSSAPAQQSQNNTVATASKPSTTVPDGVYGVVSSSSGLNLRSGGSQQASVVTLLGTGDCLDVYEISNGWARVSYYGTEGYVSEEFIELKNGQKPPKPEPASYNLTKGEQIIAYGKKFLGTPYVWAGTDLRNGVDCSGFVYAVMRDNGISLNRSSSAMASNGFYVPKSQLQPGDLVLFDTSGGNGISHVGIYMGGGDFIHSSSSRKTWGVTINSLNEDYYVRNYVTARRVIS